MAIISHRENSILTVFACTSCSKYFQQVNANISCAVNHPPGSCCHYSDKELAKETVAILLQVIHQQGQKKEEPKPKKKGKKKNATKDES